jgi:REP-associated tyrosine transposase
MARPLRVEYPGAFYHVIHRGNAGENIFKSIRDREIFLEYFAKSVERFGVKIHTYCLMTNHYHMLVETPQANLSQAIKWINVSYAAYFNRKRRRSGHLFQGRFKSILVDADEYLKQLSRYIHLNPLQAKIVNVLEEYKWSSYPAFIGNIKSPDWLETDWLLSTFGKNHKSAAINYQNFVEKIDIAKLENPAKELTGGFILGSVDFVDWVKETFLSKRSAEKEITQLKHLKPKLNPDDIVSVVCDEMNCERDLVLQKGLKKNLLRDMAIYLARDLTGESGVELGRYFGNICGAAITLRYNHIAKEIQRDRKLKARISRLKNRIINN